MDNVEPATRRHHPIARFLYVTVGLITSLFAVVFAGYSFMVPFVADSADAQHALVSKVTAFWFYLAASVFFGLAGLRLLFGLAGLRVLFGRGSKVSGVLLWLSGVVLALLTTYISFVRGSNTMGDVLFPLLIILPVLCLWWRDKER